MRKIVTLAFCGLATSLIALSIVPAQAAATKAAAPAPGGRYAPKGWADRIVLAPGANAATEMGVAWRTDTRQTEAVAEIVQDIDGPLLAHGARRVTGTTETVTAENGAAHHHHVTFTGLSPATRYVYRVKGVDGWSEWVPFTTAASQPAPFRFVYFGDTQDDILEIGSRVIRSAFQAAGPVALAVHAGDQVSQREKKAHDDEYGEWAEAGGPAFRMIPQLVAAGNHEYQDATTPDGKESRVLSTLWAHYTLPGNGAPSVKRTTYFVDYQDVRFVVLDGTSAIDLGTLEDQTRWLEQTLAASKARWNIIVMHQPAYTCARPDDIEPVKSTWTPIFSKYKVDLVLQGHDHCYSRISHPDGAAASHAATKAGSPIGPVYMVSVVGSKMYGLNDRASTQPVRVAENTELYQMVDVSADRLAVRAYTATGNLYDAFAIVRGQDGRNRLEESREPLLPTRKCDGKNGPDNRPCSARGK